MSEFNQAEQKFNQADQAQQSYINMAESGARLPTMLREAVSERTQNSPLFAQRDQAVQNVLTAPSESRADLAQRVQSGTILSPNQQQSIQASREASAIVPLLSINDLLQARLGGVDTAVNAGLGAFQTLLGAKQAEAQLAQQSAQDYWDRLYQQEELALAKQKAANSGSGSSSFLESLAPFLFPGLFGGQTQADTGLGEEPNFTPAQNGSTWVNDQGVAWQFQDNEWVPIGRQ